MPLNNSAWQRLRQQPLPAFETFNLRRITPQISSLVSDFTETRNDLVKQYGTPRNDESGIFDFKPEAGAKFNAELMHLLESEQTIDIEPISVGQYQEFKISAKDLELLDWLIVE